MTYLASTSDDMGLIVWNNGSTVTTTFNLYVDSTAATGSIVINGGAGYTGSTNVTLALSATDSQTGVAEMRFGNTGDPWSAWEPYATTKSWTLPSGDGNKYVWVQFRNNAGMISNQYSDGIYLDTSVPTGSLVINSGATYATSASVNLTLSASDSGSGVADMHIGNSGGSWDPWETYTTSKAWNLIAGDVSKSVWVQYRDNAGNISNQYGDEIILDTTAPTGSVTINGGAAETNSLIVTLNLSASDATSGMSQMRFSNNSSIWSPWQAYGTTKSGWDLSTYGGNSSPGTKTTYVQYRDAAGIVSLTYSDSINYVALPACEGDFNGDGDVDGSDLAVFAADFGRTDCAAGPPCEGDFNSDNDVDGSDLAVFAADFGRTDCP
jgi:hypothetical protein